jgi:hypothetical protein
MDRGVSSGSLMVIKLPESIRGHTNEAAAAAVELGAAGTGNCYVWAAHYFI